MLPAHVSYCATSVYGGHRQAWVCLHPFHRRNRLWEINLRRNPHIRMLCVEKKLCTSSLPVHQKKVCVYVCVFYFLKAMMLKLLQTRLCRAFQRGIMAALGRQCQKTLDFEL